MTHLYIEQNGITEEVSSSVISKLYELASGGTLDGTSDLKGRLSTPHCRELHYNYFTKGINNSGKRFPDLYLTVTEGVYLDFADPVIENYWKNSQYGDGEGITLDSAASATSYPKRETATNTSSEVIPTYNSETSTELNDGNYAFYKDTTVTSFNELGKFTNITEIRTSMFRNSSLQHIDLSNITTIYAAAFAKADLTGIVNLPKLTTWGARQCSTKANMDNQYFSDNSNMTEIHIGSQVPDESKITSIQNYTFMNCSSLNNITGLSKITRIDVHAFKGCTSLENLEDLNTDSSIDINSSAFEDCTNLKCIDITKAEFLGPNIFKNCSNLIALDTNDPEHINDNTEYTISSTSIRQSMFSGTNFSGKTIIAPNISSISGGAFNNSKLRKFVGSNVTEILGEAFNYCTNLQEVWLGNVKTIGSGYNGVFRGCTSLTTLKLGNLTNDLSNVENISPRAFQDCSIQFPSALNLSSLKTLGNNAFVNHTEIQSITSLGSITSLSANAFQGCKNLTSVNFPSTLKSIYVNAFDNTNITQVVVPEGVEMACIGQMQFDNDRRDVMKYIEFPSTVTQCGTLFHRCFANDTENTKIFVLKATTPPTATIHENEISYSQIGASKFLGIYVPDSALSAYQAAEGVWSLQYVQDRLKPISQLQTDSPTYWAVYQANL